MPGDRSAAQQRRREWFHGLSVPPGLWTIVRVDGRSFSKLTEASYRKPYDERLRDTMLAAAQPLVEELGGRYGYTQSDEISVLLGPDTDLFGRGVEKLVSISAGIASAAFTAAAGAPAVFDSRLWIGADREDVIDYFCWRQADAARSALNTWCYWTLRAGGADARAATTALDGLGTAAKNELLHRHGISFNEVPGWQRRGIGLRWQWVDRPGWNPLEQREARARQRRLSTDQELPIKDAYRALLADAIGPGRDEPGPGPMD